MIDRLLGPQNPLQMHTKRCVFAVTLRLMPTTSVSPHYSTESCARKQNRFYLPGETPPIAKKVPYTVTAHGMIRKDPYLWMRNTGDPDFVEYLNRENSYAQAFMADTELLQQTLVTEMKSRMPTNISTPPNRWGPWLYYQYMPEGKEYPVLCRRPATDRSGWFNRLITRKRPKEEILLDWNQIAEQYGYVHVGACRISPDHNFIAYTLDTTGSENFLLRVKALANGHVMSCPTGEGVVSVAWAKDSRTLFYTVTDEYQRPHRVLRTNIRSSLMKGVTVYRESDSNFCVDITSTKDGKFVTINSNSRTSSEVYVINAANPLASLRRVWKRASGVQCFLEHNGGFFYILTNAPLSRENESESGGYYLARCLANDFDASDWQTVITPNDDIALHDMDMFNRHIVLSLKKGDVLSLCSVDMPINVDRKIGTELRDLKPWYFPLPPSACTCVPGLNLDYMSSVYRVVLSSPVIPDMIVDYNMSTRVFSIVQQEDVLGVEDTSVYDAHKQHLKKNECVDTWFIGLQDWKHFSEVYVCERKEVTSHDGVKVPLTILYSPAAWKKDESFGVLFGYGAYGEALDKSWCSNRLSLLDRGWVLAFADVRGGAGVDSSSWHKFGCGVFKQNSIQDFTSCAKYLVDNGYVHKHRLSAIGCSAGGTLLGAAINTHPDLFCSAILKVPFLDILNTLSDPSLPLTVLDYEEFGNPQKRSDFDYILRYSPYENIRQSICYPSMLVMASYHDSRVGVWEAAKWVARVRDMTCSSCSPSLVLKTNMTSGHFGEGGRYADCEETAFNYAYLMKVSGFLRQST